MGKFLFAVVAAVASLALVESLVCNQCAFNLLGRCFGSKNVTCSTNTSVCYTDKYTFTVFSENLSFNTSGCRDTSNNCSNGTTGNMLGIQAEIGVKMIPFSSTTECCTTDVCNKLTLTSAAPSIKTLMVAIGGAILASVWGNFL